MNTNTILEEIYKAKIITICRNIPTDHIIDTGLALSRGNIRFMEITFNIQHEADTLLAIKRVSDQLSEKICVGAGTVTTTEQVEMASAAGARYIISPNTDVNVIKKTKELGLISIPGALTPSEIQIAWNAGADIVKLFPAADLGSGYIRSVRAPLSHIPMMAVGGINPDNMQEFLKTGIVGFGIGSNIVNSEYIKNQEYDKLTELALQYTRQII